MSETCFVLFPELKHCTIRTAIVCLDSLLGQLKRKDPDAAIEKIVFGNDFKLQIRVAKNYSGVNYTGFLSERQERRQASCVLPENSSVSFVINEMEKLKRQLYPWILQRGWYSVESINFQNNLFVIERSKQIMTTEKLHKTLFPNQPPSKLLLIDGSNLLCEGYYATTKDGKDPYRNAAGVYTNGVFAMTKRLLWLLRDYRPTHVAICWDVSRDSLFRCQLYPHYKGLRDEKPTALKEQYETAWRLFEKMGIYQAKVESYEADDLMGTLARRWSEEVGDPCYLVSNDHDLYQLLNENVSILQRQRKGQGDHLYTKDDFIQEHSMDPHQWIDVKALLGESGKSSDNIPGVKGVGEAAAFPLIRQYGSIEELYNCIHELEGTPFKRYIKPLLQDSEMAALSKQLVRIVTDVSELQHVRMDTLKLSVNKSAMIHAFKALEFHSIINDIVEGRYRAS